MLASPMYKVLRFGSPPRRLSRGASLQLLFGGAESQLGWLLIAVGSMFGQVFLSASDVSSIWRFRGELATADAKVTRCRQTTYSVGGSGRRRGTPVFANYYAFDGGTGVSYATGDCLAAGTPVTVEYVVANRNISRISGMREKPLGRGRMFVLVYLVAGVALVVSAMRKGLQRGQVLCHGLAAGKLIAKSATNTRVNKRTVYEMEFEFVSKDGRFHRAKVRTHEPEKFEDEQRQNMLYDPRHPSKVVLLGALQGRLATNDAGDVIAGAFELILALFLPVVAIAINVIAFRLFFA